MYIRKAKLTNIRSIQEMEWAVNKGEEAGWHVILGDNGSGKSSFLRALALGLMGPRTAEALRLDWAQWITRGQARATIELQVAWDDLDLLTGNPNLPRGGAFTAGLEIRAEQGK